MSLTPEFDPDQRSYTVDTNNATNKVTAKSDDNTAVILITLNNSSVTDALVENGTSVTWASGTNVLTVTVSADGKKPTEYIITVNKT